MAEKQKTPLLHSPHVGRHVLIWLNEVQNASLIQLESGEDEGSVQQVMKLWVRLSLLQTRRRPEIAVSSLLKHVLPVIGHRSLSGVTRLQLNRLFNILIADGKKEEARRVFSLCKQFLSWAEIQGYLDHSPLSAMKKRDIAGRSTPPGTRTLSDAEVWVFWHGLDEWELSEQCRWALRLCLLSARRPDEVVQARKQEFNLESGIWRQGDRNKSQREHILPITPMMRTCIDALLRASPEDSPWLVPSPVTVSRPLSKGAITQALRRMIRADRGLGLEPFTTRDLRRTARSRLAALDTPNDVARKIMNHALEGIDRVYDTHNYLPQMQQALNALSDSIKTIIAAPSYHALTHRYQGEKLHLSERALLFMEP
ncbi:site-specific integrase [Erwinia sp. S43]|uniref:tyrosine-type recombinase/integrase n=1 Tax=Erwiniaceae TaxID=1903409 RepID=UPI0019091594|nr:MULTISPECIES: site-specific integrase [Erwiniaceae]MBK0031469.1 site-specific integrase [Erwinia sp. S43]MBM7345168.1 integrase [Pantoea coffeiphila]MCW1872841.1 site-specific integrase [Erwinia sp. INIA01]